MRIVLPDSPNEAELFAAERIVEYFKFTAAEKITGPSAVKVVKKEQLGPKDRYFEIRCRPGANGISRKGLSIVIEAPDALTMRENTDALLRVMDRRFPWFMNFVMHSKMSGDVVRKFELNKHGLPWKPCFEAESMKGAK